MQAKLSVAHLAAPRHPLRSMEDQIDRAIADNANVTLAMIEARQRAGLDASQGHTLLTRNLSLGTQLGDLRGATVSLHEDCLTFLKTSVEIERMYGDQWDCKPSASGIGEA